MAKVIAIAIQKGGCAKTTTAVHLSVGLAKQGRKVLAIDFDPQGDLTSSFGILNGDSLTNTIASSMENVLQGKSANLNFGAIAHVERVNLIPSNMRLTATGTTLDTAPNRETVLRKCIEDARQQYDYIIIDCPPILSILTINALAAADNVIIPILAQWLPANSMTKLLRTIKGVQRGINPALVVEGILLTMVDGRETLPREIETLLRQQYGSVMRFYDTQIPRATVAAKACAFGQSLFEYAPRTKVAKAYESFVTEVLTDG